MTVMQVSGGRMSSFWWRLWPRWLCRWWVNSACRCCRI